MHSALDDEPVPGFQPGGQAWDPRREDAPGLLATAQHIEIYPIYQGSNHTFLVTLHSDGAGESLAIYKPARGEYPLYDFPSGTLYRREVAAWLVDAILRWYVVPPTVVGEGKYGQGSVQLYIETAESAEVELAELRRMALLDVIINNADRKADHCLPGSDGTLWGIDHGLTFHTQAKLRTVLWHFAGTELEDDERSDLHRALRVLQRSAQPDAAQLRELVSPGEWRALLVRLERVLDWGMLPDPRYKPVPYRW